MMERKTNNTMLWIVAAAVVVAVIGVVAYMMMSNDKDDTSAKATPASSSQVATDTNNTTNKASTSATTIVFTNDGFAKSSYTVKKGEAVTVKNESSDSLQFSSGEHPAHMEETELNMGTLAQGESGTFTPTKTGSWSFHDHMNAQQGGTLIVTE